MKIWTLVAALALLPGCGDNGGGEDGSSGTPGTDTNNTPTTGGSGEDETQVPPTTGTRTTMRAWLDAGHYKSWKCQPASHEPLMPVSPHGKNRICSNAVLSAHGDGEYPVDASAVKELYADDGTTIHGYAVYRHVKAGTDGGSWYWYEDVPDDSPVPHDPDGVVADGLGDSGKAMSICVSCHMATGLDADHPGHDFVYIQVK